jgi:hypothetical protein
MTDNWPFKCFDDFRRHLIHLGSTLLRMKLFGLTEPLLTMRLCQLYQALTEGARLLSVGKDSSEEL